MAIIVHQHQYATHPANYTKSPALVIWMSLVARNQIHVSTVKEVMLTNCVLPIALVNVRRLKICVPVRKMLQAAKEKTYALHLE